MRNMIRGGSLKLGLKPIVHICGSGSLKGLNETIRGIFCMSRGVNRYQLLE